MEIIYKSKNSTIVIEKGINMKFIKPAHLSPGDTVGIVSPSSHISNFPRRLERGVFALRELGLNVKFGKNAKKAYGYNAGTAEERASDIHDFVVDQEVSAIICSTGGLNANSVLDLLDYDLIRNNPKVFCGFSDITALNNAIAKLSGLVTFSGPTVLPTFGMFGGPHKFSIDYFKKAVFNNEAIGELECPNEYSDESLFWDKEDDRSPCYKKTSGHKLVYDAGSVAGVLWGGNFDTFCYLGGTRYFPELDGAILFLEDVREKVSTIERRLVYLEQLGVFRKIKGIIYGRPANLVYSPSNLDLYKVLGIFGKKYKLTVVAQFDIGHTVPIITIPLGIMARIKTSPVSVEIIESATK